MNFTSELEHDAGIKNKKFIPAISPDKTSDKIDDQLKRIFHTAMVSSHKSQSGGHSQALKQVMESPAFHAILNAVRELSQDQNLGPQEAAEEIIDAFRKLDEIWKNFLYSEGLTRLKG